MIVLGVVLLLAGAVVAYLGRTDTPLRAIGLIVAVVGLVLLVIVVLRRGDAEAAAFTLLALGMVAEGGGGTAPPHSAGVDEAAEPVSRGSLLDRRPVLFAFVVTATPILAAFVLGVLDATAIALPDWIPVALTGLGPLLGTLATLWAQAKVTPTVAPRDDAGEPLVPIGATIDGPDEEV